jgi:1,4-dihydroxy-2-naphthoate octaprenyltransferase
VGLGFSYNLNHKINWLDFSLIILLIVLIHGVASHALNDREDWLSGTDQVSAGILSGGSGVVKRGEYSVEKLAWMGRITLYLVLILTGYFLWSVGPPVLLIIGIAVWAAIAYSCPPLRLSYRPLLGEWLCAFPAVSLCAVGTFYVLTGNLQPIIIIAGGINSLLAMGLLMHHHISDVKSDLQANPRKLTTVALVGNTLGMRKTPLVAMTYFLLALLMGVVGGWFFHSIFWITVPAALGCIIATLTTAPENIKSITNREYFIYWLIIGDAVIKTLLLFYLSQ